MRWRRLSARGRPEIVNTDQGSQFTGDDFLDVLGDHGVAISMDGRGRFRDNIFVERLWRSLKYEEVCLKAYQNVAEARRSIAAYLEFYNHERLHQALGYRAPRQVFEEALRVTILRRGRKRRCQLTGTLERYQIVEYQWLARARQWQTKSRFWIR
jgi:transposase InsO family protein